MKFSGFNGFDQFDCDVDQINIFKVFKIPFPNIVQQNIHNVQIQCTWNVTAIAMENKIMLRGFLSGQPNQTTYVIAEDKIKMLQICENYCLVLLANGKIYKLQHKVKAILEEVKLAETVVKHSIKRNIFGEPKIENFPNIEVTHIACGELIAVAITRYNVVYTIPNRVHKFEGNFHVQQVECGVEHALLLDRNGNLYSWGIGLRGQLGAEKVSVREEVPVLIEALAGIKITFIAAGGWHSAAVSSFGDLYTWGFNSNGQLGLRLYQTQADLKVKEPTVYPLPQIIDFSQDFQCKCSNERDESACDIVAVYAGTRHTVVRLVCGALFVTGWNAYGQLGLNSSIEYIDTLTMLEVKSNNVICGSWCTVIDDDDKNAQ